MMGEQLMQWMNESELTVAQVADCIGLDADAVFSQCFSSNSVGVEFETALRNAFPDDLDLIRLLSACPHCWDGLVDSDDEYNEPVYCQRCAQGLRLELARIQGQIDNLEATLRECHNDQFVPFVNTEQAAALNASYDNEWKSRYIAGLENDIAQYQGLRDHVGCRLAELEAAA